MPNKLDRLDLVGACNELGEKLIALGNRTNVDLGVHLQKLALELYESVTTSREREKARMTIVAMSDAHEMDKGKRRGVKPPPAHLEGL